MENIYKDADFIDDEEIYKFLKGCDEDGQELKFTESQWLVEIDNGDS